MFLVTTADEKYWNKEDKIFFLGEWCKLFQNKEALSELNFETVAYHWSDKNKFQRLRIFGINLRKVSRQPF